MQNIGMQLVQVGVPLESNNVTLVCKTYSPNDFNTGKFRKPDWFYVNETGQEQLINQTNPPNGMR